MKWFRLYTEARTDAKLRRLTRDQHWAWFQLLCYAAEQEERGVIMYENDEVLAAEVTDGDVQLLHETLKRLETLTIVTWNVSSRFITFKNFEKRQFGNVTRNAKSSTDRVRKWREQQRLRKSETHETWVKHTETRYETGETPPDTDSDSDFTHSPGAGDEPEFSASHRDDTFPPQIEFARTLADGSYPGPHIPDESVIDRIRLLIDKANWPLQVWEDVKLRRRKYPTAWIWKALKRCWAKNKRINGWAYVGTILDDWSELGEPSRGKEDEFDDDLNLLPAPPPNGKSNGGRRHSRGDPELPSRTSQIPVRRADNDPRKPQMRSKNAVNTTPAREGA